MSMRMFPAESGATSPVPLHVTQKPTTSAGGGQEILAASRKVRVEVVDAAGFAGLGSEWRELTWRAAEANVFMEPALVGAAERSGSHGDIRVLLAWDCAAETPRRLLGVWAFVMGRPTSGLPLRVLRSPTHELNFLATPVVDTARMTDVLEAMIEAIAQDRRLPNFITLKEMGDGGPVMAALCAILEARGSPPTIFRRTERAALRSDLDDTAYFARAVSSGTRNKLRRRRRGLATCGSVTTTMHRAPEDAQAAFEEFLTLEASGWKGDRGTALLCDQRQSKFARDFIQGLAADGLVTIGMLRVDGRPAAARIVLRSGCGAFTWKSAYDETYRDYSPGILLLEDFTRVLLADEEVSFVDSCNYDGDSYMADFWMERQAIADLLFDARRGRHLGFVTTARFEDAYQRTRSSVKATYLQVKDRSRKMADRIRTRGGLAQAS